MKVLGQNSDSREEDFLKFFFSIYEWVWWWPFPSCDLDGLSIFLFLPPWKPYIKFVYSWLSAFEDV